MSDEHRRVIGGRYEIVRRLDKGGSAHVYLAEDLQAGRALCAVKELRPGDTDPTVRRVLGECFEQEKKYLDAFKGFNGQIPRHYESFVATDEDGEERPVIVEEYIEGRTLRRKLDDDGPMSEAAVREVLVRLLPVIAHIHAEHYIHQDINPKNIILRSADGLPVLVDYGSVKDVEKTRVVLAGEPAPLSVVIGTPGYIAPEHASRRPVYASDLYSLGVTAIEMLTGVSPSALAHDPAAAGLAWRHLFPKVTPDFAAVLDKAVSDYANLRGTAASMLEALESVAVPESDERIRRQLSVSFSALLERRPQSAAGGYRPCAEEIYRSFLRRQKTSAKFLPLSDRGPCEFYLSRRDEYCPNCGHFNPHRLDGDDQRLLNLPAAELVQIDDPPAGSSWLHREARNITTGAMRDGRRENYGCGLTLAGIPLGLAAGWLLVEDFFNSVGYIVGVVFLGLAGGLLLFGVALLVGSAVMYVENRRQREWEARRDQLLRDANGRKAALNKKLEAATSEHRRKGLHLTHIESVASRRAEEISKLEKNLQERLTKTLDSELQVEEQRLRGALAGLQRQRAKCQIKLLEIHLLRLHNRVQAQTSRDQMRQADRKLAEEALGELYALAREMSAELRAANILDSDTEKDWFARVLRAHDVLKQTSDLLTIHINDLTLANREGATVAPPAEFVRNLDLLNAYVTYEDFYQEYQQLHIA